MVIRSAEIFSFFSRFDKSEGWLDNTFERRWQEHEASYRFEDRIQQLLEASIFDKWKFVAIVPLDWLDYIVESCVMTQKEVDQFKSWLENPPDSFDEGISAFPGNLASNSTAMMADYDRNGVLVNRAMIPMMNTNTKTTSTS